MSSDSKQTMTQSPLTLLVNIIFLILAAVKVLASTWISPEGTLIPRGGVGGPPKGHKEARCFTTTSIGRSPSRVQKATAAPLLAPTSSQTAATKETGGKPSYPLLKPGADSWAGGDVPSRARLEAQAERTCFQFPPLQPLWPGRVSSTHKGSLELGSIPGSHRTLTFSYPVAQRSQTLAVE